MRTVKVRILPPQPIFSSEMMGSAAPAVFTSADQVVAMRHKQQMSYLQRITEPLSLILFIVSVVASRTHRVS